MKVYNETMTTTHELRILGPNGMPANSATFHVHAANCADVRKAKYSRCDGGYVETHTSVQSVVEGTYSDILAEGSYNGWEDLLSEFDFFPCTAGLSHNEAEFVGDGLAFPSWV